MPNRHPHLARRTGYVFILWADKFEEAEAAIFATELRRAGLPVKLIGLTGEWSTGIHGLALLSDLTLGEALPLASKALCVILPCHAATARRLENDPRVLDFFEQANLSGAQFIVKHGDGGPPAIVARLSLMEGRISTYTEIDDLGEFARDIAGSLSSTVIDQ